MSFFRELKHFISRGNAIDMSVGIILGVSFGKVVDALVNKIIMPPIGILIGGIDFSNLKIILKHATDTSPAVSIDYGIFINSVISFFIVGTSIFVLIKIINKFLFKTRVFTKQICTECKMEIPIDARKCGFCTTTFEHKKSYEEELENMR